MSETTAAPAVTLSAAAATKVRDLLAAEGDPELMLRIAARPGGCCSGFSYEMYLDAEKSPDDHLGEADGVRVLVDPASAPHLKGASLDYRDTPDGGSFAIDNPNARGGGGGGCGCSH